MSDRVAIVGMGGLFAAAPSLDDFWALIRDAGSAAGEPPPGRWLIPPADCHSASVQPDHVISRRGCFLADIPVDPELPAGLDPLFHLALHVGKQAWQGARTAGLARRRVGVTLGNIALPTAGSSTLARDILGRTFNERLGAEAVSEAASPLNRYVTGLPAGLLAKALGLGGPCFTLDAACASSLYALKLAVDELTAGRADAMLAGGLCRPDTLYTQMGFSQLQALSPSGRCAPFDAAADGLVVGEGAGMVLLKRLDDALAAGDRILAVIAGIGLSNDAEGKLLAPSTAGQVRALRQAYEQAGWSPDDVDLIECHATGTPVGDAVELASLRQVRSGGACVIGSVKSNVGHTLTAAGAAGLLKVLLALREQTLPPTAHFRQPAHVAFGPFRVLREAEPWRQPTGRSRRAAINAFGFGGINAHVLVEEWREPAPRVVVRRPPTQDGLIAIVGADACFGPWPTLARFAARVLGQETQQPAAPRRWWGVERSDWFTREFGAPPAGYYLDEVTIPADRFRVPPRELEESLPQQILALRTACNAVADCRFRQDRLERTGVLVGVSLDLNTTNFQLRWALWRQVREWSERLGLSAAESARWLAELREAAGPPLNANRTMGALASIAASRIARELRIGGPSFTLSSEETSGLTALTTACRMLQRGDLDQAIVAAVDLAGEVRAVLAGRAARGAAFTPCDGAAALVLKRLDDARRDGDRVYAVLREGDAEGQAVDAEPDIGHAGAASGLASVVKAALALYQEKMRGPVVVRARGVMGDSPAVVLQAGDHGPIGSDEPASTGRLIRVPVGGEPFHVPPAAIVRPNLPVPAAAPDLQPLSEQFAATLAGRGEAHAAYLRFADRLTEVMTGQVMAQTALLADAPVVCRERPVPARPAPAFDRDRCLEFAVGRIANVLGKEFAEIDRHPTRVRLPAEPLMLVDRIVSVEGEPRSMTAGRLVTEHDVRPGGWYLDGGRMPACVSIEAGQADLFLSAYLGIDFITKGEAVYRLLDAEVTFHRGLPRPGEVVRYDIQIERFFEHAGTHFFRFRFDGSIDGQPLLTMRDGCAGFFTADALRAGRGVVQTELDRRPSAGVRPADWVELVPQAAATYDDAPLDALRRGDLAGCFGPAFAGVAPADDGSLLPGGRMKLIDRVTALEPAGGRFGLGLIRGEADIHPDDWFLTCHFVDDMVMPGTLMYECCLHTLRVFLLRLGWLPEAASAWEPVPGVASRLKCRGQVTAATQRAVYEVVIKELGYRPEPWARADAIMYADGKAIVEVTDMTLRLTGTDLAKLRERWASAAPASEKPAVRRFDRSHIVEFALGKPSRAFGERYRDFDDRRFIARLPAPPFSFIHRVTTESPPWQMQAGSRLVAEYDVSADDWYFAAERQPVMPFAVLLEAVLQPCGFLAAYMGSALQSGENLHFRNLGGRGTLLRSVGPQAGTLTITARATQVSQVGGMIIQHYEFEMRDRVGPVYRGETNFGFFTPQALAQQVGVRDAALLPAPERQPVDFPGEPPFPDRMLRMIDRIDYLDPQGGPRGLGFIQGSKQVDPAEWFFQAHFYQDPVWPGSLGLEAFVQLLKYMLVQRFGGGPFTMSPASAGAAAGVEDVLPAHRWIYRGQVLPSNRQVVVQAYITAWDERNRALCADGLLSVDGKVIYQMLDFGLRLEQE